MDLAKKLEQYGYRISRQAGSHMRLTMEENGEHHLTIPKHQELRVGLLSAILHDVAKHLGMDRDDLLKKLFG
jgi:predicted RNA binding protein YcfA (HicA-like mRNA interferase family)